MADEIMTVQDVAEYTKLSESYIYHRIREIPHLSIGKAVRFRRSDVDGWLETKRRYTRQDIIRRAATYTALNPLRQ